MSKNETSKEIKGLQERVSSMESKLETTLGELQMQSSRIFQLESLLNKTPPPPDSTMNLNQLWSLVEDLQDRLYEIDKSWKNNLLFFGIKLDSCGAFESSECLENKVKTMLKNDLNIVRDISISRAQRMYNGFESRGGSKPVLVNFHRWTDKEEILRKSKILKNSSVTVEEDFSRGAKARRKELEKFARSVRSLSPEKRCIFKYDQLQIDDNIYVYNDKDGRVERLPPGNGIDEGADSSGFVSNGRNVRSRGRAGNQCIGASNKRTQSVESILDKVPPRIVNSSTNGRSSNDKHAKEQ